MAVERGVLHPLDAAFRWMRRRSPFTFSLALVAVGFGFGLAGVLTALVSVVLAAFEIPGFPGPLLMLLVPGAAAGGSLLHSSLFAGLFNRERVSINIHARKGLFHPPENEADAGPLLLALENLPCRLACVAGGYSVLSALVFTGAQIDGGITSPLVNSVLSITLSLTLFVSAVHVLAEILIRPLQHRIKQFLFSRKISFVEKPELVVARRFLWVVLLAGALVLQLSGITYFAAMRGSIFPAIVFAVVSFGSMAVILFLSFLSVKYTLHEMEYALIDIAYGRGSGAAGAEPESDLVHAAHEIGDLRSNLEKRISERTRELSETMAALRRTLDDSEHLKLQQDGDFFLTSLLLEPLSRNRASCVNLSVDFFVEEKKKFQFKKWQREIGGDICVSHSIFLKNRIYTVVLNADAMGKSMQGAGGAIVIGACVKSIIDRTRFSSMEQDRHPEDWIHRAYLELHRVFEGFEGSMLVSLVLALIDDESGLMYYVNAEHPWTVLYRHGKASFIENELSLRKLGMPQPGTQFAVKLFRFKPRDVIIMGSDGRDDLMIGDGTEATMNENEGLFLSMVERGSGLLPEIYKAIADAGRITDDLSLVRVSFREEGDTPAAELSTEVLSLLAAAKSAGMEHPECAVESLRAAHAIRRDHPLILRRLIRMLARQQDYAGALEHLDRYLDLRPDDTNTLFIGSYCYLKTGQLQKAAELCERIVLRQPREVRYLLQLARIYALRRDYFEADRILDQILQSAPDNRHALALKNSL